MTSIQNNAYAQFASQASRVFPCRKPVTPPQKATYNTFVQRQHVNDLYAFGKQALDPKKLTSTGEFDKYV